MSPDPIGSMTLGFLMMSTPIRVLILFVLTCLAVLTLSALYVCGFPVWQIALAAAVGLFAGLQAQRRHQERAIAVLACCTGMLFLVFGFGVFTLGVLFNK